jgi:UDP-2-acetamido-2-deoxy-ribo-hexuluronate aminotransferase
LMALAKTRELYIIEDNAQSIGAKVLMDKDQWQMAGTIGQIGTTSFYPSKNLGCYGDGGALMSRDDAMAHKLMMIANHGMQKRYYHDMIGVNSRLDSIQAAVLNAKLPHLDEYNKKRRAVADQYDKLLGPLGDIIIPERVSWSEHIFHQYTIRVHRDVRNELQTYLAERKVPSMIYYPVPMHDQAAFNKVVRRRVSLANTDRICKEVLSLPMHPDLTEEQVGFICDHVKKFFKG